MSKAIIIHEGGVAKQITADKLKTDLVGGGSCLWVPEDGTRLGTKHISENGTYRASDDGYYGYSEVTVSGVGTATGKAPDGSGDDAVADVDPSTGEIRVSKVPSRIEVATPPTNPYGIYIDGQTITTEGMVVKAYLESGAEYGVVPLGEITMEPTTATYDPATDQGGTAESDIESIAQYMPIPISSVVIVYNNEGQIRAQHSAPAGGAITAYQRQNGSQYMDIRCTASGPFSSSTPYTRDDKTVHYAAWTHLSGGYDITPCTLDAWPNSGYYGPLAWTMIYGTITRRGSRQQIRVSWPRLGDGAILETTFDILVGPRAGSGED